MKNALGSAATCWRSTVVPRSRHPSLAAVTHHMESVAHLVLSGTCLGYLPTTTRRAGWNRGCCGSWAARRSLTAPRLAGQPPRPARRGVERAVGGFGARRTPIASSLRGQRPIHGKQRAS
ncbi:hypothetical protein M8494_17165 [Serratia ureilytica]